MSAPVEDATGAMQGRVTGVIIPPPEIRAVADKTAQFVARNGKSFEQKILGSAEGKTAKFNFMKVMDPYHAYYEMKIKEFEDGVTAAPQPSETVEPVPAKEVVPPPQSAFTTVTQASVQNPLAKFAMNKPTAPPLEYQFVMNHPSGISNCDVDIIKLTARYTAINGREFLSGLAQREQKNPQFDFLKPTHMLFSYFTSFVDAYAKILVPSKELISRVKKNTNRLNVLENAVQRCEWSWMEEERKKQEESNAEADRSASQAIDWYDFQVVETIDFGENDLLDMMDMASLNPYAERPESVNGYADMDVDISMAPPPPPLIEEGDDDAMDMDDIKVVSDYIPRTAGNKSKAMTMIDPISGKAVPVSEVGEHMRVQLIDPKWRIEQQRFQNKQKETGFAEGASIADSLKQFAKQRGDIFSTGDEDEAALLDEQRKKQRRLEETNQVIWDGHQSSLAQVQQHKSEQAARQPFPAPVAPVGVSIGPSGPYAMPPLPMVAGSGMLPYGSMPLPPPPQPMMMAPLPGAPPVPLMPPMAPYSTAPQAYMQQPPPAAPPAPPMVAPPAPVVSEQKIALLPEFEFAAQYPAPIIINVIVPASEGEPSVFPVSIPVTSSVKDLKNVLVEMTGLAANKQQIKYMGTFLKDLQSFAAVNIGDGAQVEMIGRSRGGGKR